MTHIHGISGSSRQCCLSGLLIFFGEAVGSQSLAEVHRIWMKLGHVRGSINTKIILDDDLLSPYYSPGAGYASSVGKKFHASCI